MARDRVLEYLGVSDQQVCRSEGRLSVRAVVNQIVLRSLLNCGNSTAHDIYRRHKDVWLNVACVRPRLMELEARGLVEVIGKVKDSQTGVSNTLWQITEKGKENTNV